MGILPTVNPTFTHTTTGAITSKVIIANMGCELVALLSFDSRHSFPESRSSQRVRWSGPVVPSLGCWTLSSSNRSPDHEGLRSYHRARERKRRLHFSCWRRTQKFAAPTSGFRRTDTGVRPHWNAKQATRIAPHSPNRHTQISA